MSETKRSKLTAIISGTLNELKRDVRVGAETVAGFFVSGTLAALAPYAIPTTVRHLKEEGDAIDQLLDKHNGLEYGALFGTATGIMIDVGQALFYIANPKYLIVPAATNGISAAYEKFRNYKLALEQELQRELSLAEFMTEVRNRGVKNASNYGKIMYNKGKEVLNTALKPVGKAAKNSAKFLGGLASGFVAGQLAPLAIPTAYRISKDTGYLRKDEMNSFDYGFSFGSAAGLLGFVIEMGIVGQSLVPDQQKANITNILYELSPFLIMLPTNAISLIGERTRKVYHKLTPPQNSG